MRIAIQALPSPVDRVGASMGGGMGAFGAGDERADLVAAFSRLQELTLGSARVADFLSQLVVLAPQLAAGELSCSVTARGEHQAYTVASSDDLAASLDEVQYEREAGPCLQALDDGSVLVQDMRAEDRWGGYPADAVRAGVLSSLSLPMQVGDVPIGVLNLYSPHPHTFDDALLRTLGLFAAQAAAALTMVLRQVRQDELSGQLEQALSSRTVIDQALGILMAEQRCSADEAFALLRAHSQNTNRRIRDLAADLVARVSGRPPTTGTPFSR